MVERPGPDATSAEIARWMEEDFGEALAEGMEEATEEGEDDEKDGYRTVWNHLFIP